MIPLQNRFFIIFVASFKCKNHEIDRDHVCQDRNLFFSLANVIDNLLIGVVMYRFL